MNQVLSATACAVQLVDLCGPLVATVIYGIDCLFFGGSGLVVGCDGSFVRTWLCCACALFVHEMKKIECLCYYKRA